MDFNAESKVTDKPEEPGQYRDAFNGIEPTYG